MNEEDTGATPAESQPEGGTVEPRELDPGEMLQEGETPAGLDGTPIDVPQPADAGEVVPPQVHPAVTPDTLAVLEAETDDQLLDRRTRYRGAQKPNTMTAALLQTTEAILYRRGNLPPIP